MAMAKAANEDESACETESMIAAVVERKRLFGGKEAAASIRVAPFKQHLGPVRLVIRRAMSSSRKSGRWSAFQRVLTLSSAHISRCRVRSHFSPVPTREAHQLQGAPKSALGLAAGVVRPATRLFARVSHSSESPCDQNEEREELRQERRFQNAAHRLLPRASPSSSCRPAAAKATMAAKRRVFY